MLVGGLEIPRYLREGITPNSRGASMYTYVYGADTETLHGKPMTLQFYSEDTDCNEIFWVNEHNALDTTLDWCATRKRDVVHVVYCHNLQFDLPEFLYGAHEFLIEPGGAFDFEVGEWRLRGVYGAPTFCRMTSKRRRILFVDSLLWFQGTLAKAAELFCPDLPKLKMPKGLGEKQFPMRDDKFVEYAMRDAEVAYHIGRSVQAIHDEFSIKQAVSLADMSAKIFRHHFLNYTIRQPNDDVIWAALQSYHGGKNNVLPNAFPRWHTGVSVLDISSAYPYSMSLLPAFDNQKGYRRITFCKGKRFPAAVPEWGIYRISGTTSDCKWPVIFNHSFNPIRGRFSGIWVHGCEVNEALASGELKLTKIYGYMYDRDKDKKEPAFKKYVDEFYTRKQNEKDKVLRHMYKIILNSVYGKFIQTRKSMRQEYYDIDPADLRKFKQSEYLELRAGGMFHPFIASSITAHTRAYIHRIEHKYKAIHTATDGIFTTSKTRPGIRGYPRRGLGSLECEAAGDLVLMRNKLYILYSKNGKLKSQYFKGKRIEKFAKHGFQGTVYDLERLIAHNRRKYTVNKPNRLRQSLQRGLQVNEFVKRDMVLRVAPVKA